MTRIKFSWFSAFVFIDEFFFNIFFFKCKLNAILNESQKRFEWKLKVNDDNSIYPMKTTWNNNMEMKSACISRSIWSQVVLKMKNRHTQLKCNMISDRYSDFPWLWPNNSVLFNRNQIFTHNDTTIKSITRSNIYLLF